MAECPRGAEGIVEQILAKTSWTREQAIAAVRDNLPTYLYDPATNGVAETLLRDIADAADRDDALLAALPSDVRDRLEDWRVALGLEGEGAQ